MEPTSQKLVHSYVHGSTEVPLEYWRSFDRLQFWAEQTPDREIVVFRRPNGPREAITFSEFHRLSDGIAAYVIRNHPELPAGTSVLLLGPNGVSYCAVAVALYKAGLVVVKLHPQDKDSLAAWSRRTETKAVFYHPSAHFQAGADWLQESVGIRYDFDTLVRSGQQTASEDGATLLELLKERQSQFSADDNFCMYPTSGTTGKPKMVVQSHFAMVNSVRFRTIGALLTNEDIFFCDRSIGHVIGEFGLIMAMVDGVTLVTTPSNIFASDREAKNTAWLLSILAEEHVTSGDFFGYLVHDILNRSGGAVPPECLRSALVAGNLTTSQQMQRAMQVLPGLSNYYGSTETSMITAVCPPWGPMNDRQARQDTVGRPAMHMEVLVNEPGSRVALPLPIGVIGEVWTRGFSVMRCYCDDPERTREARNDAGWYRTGDLGYIDANGRLTITGRIKELIIRGTVNIVPSSIEEVIRAHPDVQEVMVVGISDERLSEEVGACVILHEEKRGRQEPERQTVRELVLWCLEHGLAESRDGLEYAPRYWAFLEDFPRSLTGKVIRSDVRDVVARGRGFIDGLEFIPAK